jgi:hypothetical protein
LGFFGSLWAFLGWAFLRRAFLLGFGAIFRQKKSRSGEKKVQKWRVQKWRKKSALLVIY